METGGKYPPCNQGNICKKCLWSLPTHLLYLPWGCVSRIQSKKTLIYPKECPSILLLQTCPSRNYPLLWIGLSPFPPEKHETVFCFMTSQTLLLRFCSQNPYTTMFNMLSGISRLNHEWMFHDVPSAVLWVSKFSLLPQICILFKAGVSR